VIKGERKSEQVVDEQNYYRMERSFGSFYRRLPMPEGLEPDQISANFQDGVLEVQAPKPPASKRSGKRIEIR
jgi:HSP20 family protein